MIKKDNTDAIVALLICVVPNLRWLHITEIRSQESKYLENELEIVEFCVTVSLEVLAILSCPDGGI